MTAMVKVSGVVVGALLLLIGEGVAVRAQGVAAQAKAELVRLDAVVTDASGKLVRDLKREDFVLLEDGKPQKITHFLFVGKASAAAPQATPVTEPKAPGAPATPPEEGGGTPWRYVVILVDDLHIARGNLDDTKAAVRRFVDESLAPEDEVALITTGSPGGVQQLTRDRAPIKEAIGRLTVREAVIAPAQGSRMTPAQAELILRGDRSALQLASRTMMEEPGSVYSGEGPQAAVAATGGYTPAGVVDQKEMAALQEVQRQARAVLNEALHFSQVTLSRVDDVLRGLAVLPGRKLCLLVSDGFLVGMGTSDEQTRHLRRVIDAATRSGAVVYALDARGLVTTGTDAGVAGTAAPQSTPGLPDRVARLSEQEYFETLSGLANDTGGFLVRGTNELAGGLRRMLEDNDAYYLMAYEPINTKRDGKFRRIEVKLARQPGLTVRTRRGYLAPDDRKKADKSEPAAAGPGAAGAGTAPAFTEADARALLSEPVPPNGLPVRLVVDYLDLPPSGSQAIVRAHVGLAGFRFTQVEKRYRADLDMVGGLYDGAGTAVGPPFGRRISLDLTPAEYKRAMEMGLQYQQRVLLGTGRFEVRLLVRDPAVALVVGGATQSLEVPDLSQKKLALSSVFLSSSATPAASASADSAGVGESLRDVQTLRRFTRSENLNFQLYVYNLLADENGAKDAVLQAQIRAGTNLVGASKPQPVTLQEKDGVPLPQSNGMPLQSLAPGVYVLRVVVVDRKANATAFRDVDFTVE
jgi:VWFA-related protein